MAANLRKFCETTTKGHRKYTIFDKSSPTGGHTREGVLESFGVFYVDNFRLLDFINFEAQDKKYWEQFADDYFYVWELIKKATITQAEKDKGNEILAKYTGLFPEDWMNLLANVKVETPKTAVITKTDDQPGTLSGEQVLVPFKRKENGLAEVQISLNGTPFNMWRDTGASITSISSLEFLKLLKEGKVSESDKIGSVSSAYADGSSGVEDVYRIREIFIQGKNNEHLILNDVAVTVSENLGGSSSRWAECNQQSAKAQV